MMQEKVTWVRSSFCSGGQCLEVATAGEAVLVRDTKKPWEVLRFGMWQWRDFMAAVKAGDFD